ncbi:MAG: hypothetical protein LR015_10290 [Verrucomicrobia bacterium]|nr:hypothetical protein [Verrucomicrobiota bacterium]
MESKTIGERVFGHDKVDVGSVLFSRRVRAPVGVIADVDRPEVTWWSEERRDIQTILDRALPDTFNFPVSVSEDETRMIIASSSERQSSKFHLLDFRGGSLQLIPLGESRPWLRPEEMAPASVYWINARDGKRMQVFLTVPRDRKEGERVPLLVLPHGGPWARDSWGFDPEVQFFANRGMAVLQVNFVDQPASGVNI